MAQRLISLPKETRLAFPQAEDSNDGDARKATPYLSRIFDNANTGFEQQGIVDKALLPLLEAGSSGQGRRAMVRICSLSASQRP